MISNLVVVGVLTRELVHTICNFKLQDYWNLTIRLFSVLSKTLVSGRGSYPSAEVQSVYSTDSVKQNVISKN